MQEDLHIDLNERLWALTQRVFKKDDWTLQDGTLDFCRSSTDIHPLPAPPEGQEEEEEEEEEEDAQVRKRSFHFTFVHKNDNFTNTGSGQT
eukprot:COSAG06_NODE_3436_length_5352_cov_2.997906_5_plen_91_part_00